MSASQQPHEFAPNDPQALQTQDVVFDCPHCHKQLAVNRAAAGREVTCPSCGQPVPVRREHRVVTLAEAPETKQLQAKPAWEQELLGIESALRESQHQRQEAGNAYRHHFSEASRLQLRIEKKDPTLSPDAASACQQHVAEANRSRQRMEKLDAKIKELESRRSAIRAAHP